MSSFLQIIRVNRTKSCHHLVIFSTRDISLIRKSVKCFSVKGNFCGFLMDLYSYSAQSSTKSESN